MPAAAPKSGDTVATRLTALGARLRAHREALGVSATIAAEAAGMSRVTLHRIERGEASVTMGAYINVITALGLDFELVDRSANGAVKTGRRMSNHARLPKRIALDEYPQLKRLAWQLSGAISLTPKEALAFYERNWRHVDKEMSARERDLVHLLVAELGSRRLLV